MNNLLLRFDKASLSIIINNTIKKDLIYGKYLCHPQNNKLLIRTNKKVNKSYNYVELLDNSLKIYK